MEPNDMKLGRISELQDTPFADESPLQRALADLKQRKGADEERSDRLEAMLTKKLPEWVEIKVILLSLRDACVEQCEDGPAYPSAFGPQNPIFNRPPQTDAADAG